VNRRLSPGCERLKLREAQQGFIHESLAAEGQADVEKTGSKK
jgi:hypothetical protein